MTTPTKPNEESERFHGNTYLRKRIKWVLLQCAESSNPKPIKLKTTWERFGSGLGHAFCGAVLGAVMGFVEPYLVITACAGLLGFMDQDGMIVLAGVPFGAIHGAIVGLLVGLGVRDAHGWVVGALVGLGFWAPLFLLGAHNKSNVIELVALLMPLWCGGIGAALQAPLRSKEDHQPGATPGEEIGKVGSPRMIVPMEIARNKSKMSERTIVLPKEIKACASCGAVVNCSCEICPECGCTQP